MIIKERNQKFVVQFNECNETNKLYLSINISMFIDKEHELFMCVYFYTI